MSENFLNFQIFPQSSTLKKFLNSFFKKNFPHVLSCLSSDIVPAPRIKTWSEGASKSQQFQRIFYPLTWLANFYKETRGGVWGGTNVKSFNIQNNISSTRAYLAGKTQEMLKKLSKQKHLFYFAKVIYSFKLQRQTNFSSSCF